MTYSDFLASLKNEIVPPGLSPYLEAMWNDGRDNWEDAHRIVQDLDTQRAARIHAYLHRAEGDLGNADYWYRRAGHIRPEVSLKTEWEQIVRDLLVDRS